SGVEGHNRAIHSAGRTSPSPSQTHLPVARYGARNGISMSSTHAGAACAASYHSPETPGCNTIPAALITPGADPPEIAQLEADVWPTAPIAYSHPHPQTQSSSSVWAVWRRANQNFDPMDKAYVR